MRSTNRPKNRKLIKTKRMNQNKPKVAYFSMEFALDPAIPNYAGGLGVLATDILRSAADMELPVMGVSLIYHQHDDPKKAFPIKKYFKPLKERVTILIEGREVQVTVWQWDIVGQTGHVVPIYVLDTFLPENKRWDRDLTKEIYDTNQYTRLCQEAILGIAGLRMLRALGHDDIDVFHMNEGHASPLVLERLQEENGNHDAVRQSCVFTTHTPIPAGHDRFPHALVKQVLGNMVPHDIRSMASHKEFHTTHLALNMSRAVNGVSKKHAEVCKKMFPDYKFLGITNGIHLKRWASEATISFLNAHFKGWESDPSILKKAIHLSDVDLQSLRQANKKILVDYINSQPGHLIHDVSQMMPDDYFDEDTLTITFSRRFVPYKRPLLLFKHLNQLRKIAHQKIQVIYSGVCHPGDQFCNSVMGQLKQLQTELRGQIRLAVLPNRNIDSSKILVAGSDIWLNNPEPPREACGTSGMKAALNGNLNLSTPDGWWLEAMEMHPKAGWSTGSDRPGHDTLDSESLHKTLAEAIDLYYNHPSQWLEKAKHSMALAAHFNTHRNVEDYLNLMWLP